MKKVFPILIILLLAGCQQNEVGYLDIQSEPQGAEVYVGVNSTGEVTDCILEVPTGEHIVKLLLDNYIEWTRDITVEVDDTVYLNAYLIPDTVQPGDVLWKYEVSANALPSDPAIGNCGEIYFIDDGKNLCAVSSAGKLLWRHNVGESNEPSVGLDGSVYAVENSTGSIMAFSHEGFLKWEYDVGSYVFNSPSVGSDGSLYVTTKEYLYAFSPSGGLKWRASGYYSLYDYSVVAQEGSIYCHSNLYGHLYAFAADGQLLWEYHPWEACCPSGSPISIGEGGRLYYPLELHLYDMPPEGSLLILNPDGTHVKDFGFGEYTPTPPVTGLYGRLFISVKSQLSALDIQNNQHWVYETRVCSSPTIGSEGTVYFGSTDGFLYALTPDGELKWRTELGASSFTSSALSDDGILYLGGDNGFFYAIYTESKGLANTTWPKYRADNQNTGRARF